MKTQHRKYENELISLVYRPYVEANVKNTLPHFLDVLIATTDKSFPTQIIPTYPASAIVIPPRFVPLSHKI